MARVLRDTMSNLKAGHEVFKILYPWKLFGLPTDMNVKDARLQVARNIVRCLEDEYGKNVGNEIDWELKWRVRESVVEVAPTV
jgi:hypothetical protein